MKPKFPSARVSGSAILGRNVNDTNIELGEDCARFYADPLGWVLWAFDWGHGDLKGFDGPDDWQRDTLITIGEEVQRRGFDGVNAVEPIRMSTASGHGIGKSALTAWLILWIMTTRPHAKGTVTANTVDQLKTKTWGELGKWRSRCIVGHWFEYTNTRGSLTMYHKSYAQTWRVDGQTCREENSEAFAGLHAANSTPFYIFDEGSAVPDKIWEVAEGGLTDGESMFYAFGNPTRNQGAFRETFGRQSHRWINQQIDSRTARLPNKKLIAQWEDDYGEDSDFFRVRVKGQFPRAGDEQFFPSDLVFEAMARDAGLYLGDDPLIGAFDVARGGADDCMIGFRRGFDAISEKTYRIPGEKSRDSMRVVSMLVDILDKHKPDVMFIDETGIGGPILDRLRQLGYHAIGVNFGGVASDEKKYHNKTAEMAFRMRQWLQNGGSIPDDPDLEQQLTNREYEHDKKDRLKLEDKASVKKRGFKSPDWADMLFLTFAVQVPKRQTPRGELDHDIHRRSQTDSDYNPLDAV